MDDDERITFRDNNLFGPEMFLCFMVEDSHNDARMACSAFPKKKETKKFMQTPGKAGRSLENAKCFRFNLKFYCSGCRQYTKDTKASRSRMDKKYFQATVSSRYFKQ